MDIIEIHQTPDGWEVLGINFSTVDEAYHYARGESRTAQINIHPLKRSE